MELKQSLEGNLQHLMSVPGNISNHVAPTLRNFRKEREEIMPKVRRRKEMMIRVETNERENRKKQCGKSVKQNPDYLRRSTK